jgi:NAD(P)-dependent dehydrogenase (short-subunit alcohol dehydrogenase family)
VVVHGRRAEALHAVVEAIRASGGEATGTLANLADPEDCARLVSAVLAGGGVDILVNNVGAFANRGWDDARPEDWLELYALNVAAAVRCIQGFLSPVAEFVRLSCAAPVRPVKGSCLTGTSHRKSRSRILSARAAQQLLTELISRLATGISAQPRRGGQMPERQNISYAAFNCLPQDLAQQCRRHCARSPYLSPLLSVTLSMMYPRRRHRGPAGSGTPARVMTPSTAAPLCVVVAAGYLWK